MIKLNFLKFLNLIIRKPFLMKESYDKRLNILIYGVQEDPGNAWESRKITIEKFQNFFKKWTKSNRSSENQFFRCPPTSLTLH